MIYSTDTCEMKSSLGKVILGKLRVMEKTQSWLAEEAQVSINAVSKWIRTGKISRNNLVVVAGILGLSTDEMVGLDEPVAANAVLPAFELVFLTSEEIRLVTIFRQASDVGQRMIEIAASKAPKAAVLQNLTLQRH